MPKPTTKTRKRIRETCRDLVNGISWNVIAERYGYKDRDSAMQTLRGNNTELFAAEYETAYERHAYEADAEATLVLRDIMRPTATVYDDHGRPVLHEDGSEKKRERADQDRRGAAHSLKSHVARIRTHMHKVGMELSGNVTVDHGAALVELTGAADEAAEILAEPEDEVEPSGEANNM